MHLLILCAIFGFAICNPHCTLNSDCPDSYCGHSHYPYCDERECNCLSFCKKDADCDASKTIDEHGHRCTHARRYCLSGRCHCGSDHIATQDGSCPTGHTAECHNIICPVGSHLQCLNSMCICRSDGGCQSSSDCHSIQSCNPLDHHCVDGKCTCLQITTTPKPECVSSSQCSIPHCIASDVHCLDGKCACLTPTTTTTTTTTTTAAPGSVACSSPSECTGKVANCLPNLVHCVDGRCLCL